MSMEFHGINKPKPPEEVVQRRRSLSGFNSGRNHSQPLERPRNRIESSDLSSSLSSGALDSIKRHSLDLAVAKDFGRYLSEDNNRVTKGLTSDIALMVEKLGPKDI